MNNLIILIVSSGHRITNRCTKEKERKGQKHTTNRQTKKSTKTQTDKHKHIDTRTQTETQENDKEEDGKNDLKRKSGKEVNQPKNWI